MAPWKIATLNPTIWDNLVYDTLPIMKWVSFHIARLHWWRKLHTYHIPRQMRRKSVQLIHRTTSMNPHFNQPWKYKRVEEWNQHEECSSRLLPYTTPKYWDDHTYIIITYIMSQSVSICRFSRNNLITCLPSIAIYSPFSHGFFMVFPCFFQLKHHVHIIFHHFPMVFPMLF